MIRNVHRMGWSSQWIGCNQYPGFPGAEVNLYIGVCKRMGNYVRDLVPVRGLPQSGPVAPVQAMRCAGSKRRACPAMLRK